MFYALAIVCDDFFVPSLEKICEVCTGIFPVCLREAWNGDSGLACYSPISKVLESRRC